MEFTDCLLINGSPRGKESNSQIALEEVKKTLIEAGLTSQIIQIGNKDIRGCIACRACAKTGKCCFNDEVNEVAPLFEKAKALVVASPVYYAQANATLSAFLTRLFFSCHSSNLMKVGASIAVCRRGGAASTFDQLNKFFTISGMPIASSYYWNSVHGREKGEARGDAEGLYNMRVLGRNVAFLVKSIDLGKEKFGLPKEEEHVFTHFIREDLLD